MVRALLDGRKTQTRRTLILPDAPARLGRWEASTIGGGGVTDSKGHPVKERPCVWHTRSGAVVAPRFVVGDRLYVREEWSSTPAYDDLKPTEMGGDEPLRYRADDATFNWGEADGSRVGRRRAGMHMPRWASRLTLLLTDIRVEHLQDCSEEDAIAEGVETDLWDMAPVARDYSQPNGHFVGWDIGILPPNTSVDAERVGRESYRSLWNSINGAGAWEANPWVAAITFTVEQRNIDQ